MLYKYVLCKNVDHVIDYLIYIGNLKSVNQSQKANLCSWTGW